MEKSESERKEGKRWESERVKGKISKGVRGREG